MSIRLSAVVAALLPAVLCALRAPAQAAGGAESAPDSRLSAGPLLVYGLRTDDGAKPLRVHVTDVDRRGAPRVLLDVADAPTWHARLDASHALVGGREGLSVLDLSSGRTSWTSASARAHFVGRRGDDVLFLDDGGRDGGRLVAKTWRDATPPRVVCETPLNRVFDFAEDVAFAVSADGAPSLIRIDLARGEGRALVALPANRMNAFLRMAFSPNGTRFALGHAGGLDAGRGGAALVVYDAAGGAPIATAEGIDISIATRASRLPSLNFGWIDDDRLRWSQTFRNDAGGARGDDGVFKFVDWRVSTGERTIGEPYGPIALGHRSPVEAATETAPVSERRVEGLFERAVGRIWFKGGAGPLADVRQSKEHGGEVWQDLTISPDGAWATTRVVEEGERRLVLFDGRTRERRRLATGAVVAIDWIPAAR